MIYGPLMMFSYTLVSLGVILTFSSSSLMMAWFGMEVNMIGFILSIYLSEKSESQNILFYFVVQAFSTLILISSLIFMKVGSSTSMAQSLATFALVVKLGLPPGHLWFISLFHNLDRLNIMIMSTIQKVIPLYLVAKLDWNIWVYLATVFTCLLGPLVISLTRLLGVLSHSSVLAGAWCLSACSSLDLVILFLMVYLMSLSLVLTLSFTSGQPNSAVLPVSNFSLISLFIGFLSMAGFPPFLGFFMKIYLLVQLLTSAKVLLMWALVMAGPAFLFSYLSFMTHTMKGASVSKLSESPRGFALGPSSISIFMLSVLPVCLI